MIISTLVAATLLGQVNRTEPVKPKEKSFYDFAVKDIDDKPFNLRSLKGRVVIVVNTASLCGLTPQYAGLQKLYTDYKDKGLTVIGFPANNFNSQEPGTNSEIKAFCSQQYNVTFPMMSKISVKDKDIHPLYQWLIAQSDRPNEDIEWNFAKFLLDRTGKVRYRFAPKERPESPFLEKALKELLAEKTK